MINLLKTFGIFLLFFLLMIPISFYLQSSANKERLDGFNEATIRSKCLDSPEKMTYQECFKKDLAIILANYTPQDALKVIDLIKELYRLDTQSIEIVEQTRKADLALYENWILLIENSDNVGVKRNDSSTFDIVIIPYLQYRIKNEIKALELTYEQTNFKDFIFKDAPDLQRRQERVVKKFSILKAH